MQNDLHKFDGTFNEELKYATPFIGDFFKEHYAEAITAAKIAFVTAAGASAVGSTINTIKYGDQASYYNAQGNYIGPGAEEGMTSFKQYAKKYGVYDDSGNLIGVQNIRINEEVTDESGKIAYSVSDVKMLVILKRY